MAKRITQPTFDEAVKENMDDFEMSMEDAIKDTIKQFIGQGVLLDNIDTSGGIGMEELSSAITVVINYASSLLPTAGGTPSGNDFNIDIFNAFTSLRNLCRKTCQFSVRNRKIILQDGCLTKLYFLLNQESLPYIVLESLLKTLLSLTKSIEYCDFFEPRGSKSIKNILVKYSSSSVAIDIPIVTRITILSSALRFAWTVAKSEDNKVHLMKKGIAEVISNLLTLKYTASSFSPSSNVAINGTAAPDSTQLSKDTISGENDSNKNSNNDNILIQDWQLVIQECCQLIKELCIHTDSRREMSCAYENGKIFIKNTVLMDALIQNAHKYIENPILASYALLAIRVMITNEEAVATLAQHNIIELITDVLMYFQPNSQSAVAFSVISKTEIVTTNTIPFSSTSADSAVNTEDIKINTTASSTSSSSPSSAPVHQLLKSSFGLVRNLCADDTRKALFVTKGHIIELITSYLACSEYYQDQGIVEYAVACLAAISLRSATNSENIIHQNGAILIEKCMRLYPTNIAIQKQSCCAIRNIAARSPQFREAILDAGLESCLRNAGKLMYVVDEAYAALRDLNCEVKMVKISTGVNGQTVQVENAYEQFGDYSTSSNSGSDFENPSGDYSMNGTMGIHGKGKSKLNFNPVFDETYDLMQTIQTESKAPLAVTTDNNNGTNNENVNVSANTCCDNHGGSNSHQHHDHNHDHSH